MLVDVAGALLEGQNASVPVGAPIMVSGDAAFANDLHYSFRKRQ